MQWYLHPYDYLAIKSNALNPSVVLLCMQDQLTYLGGWTLAFTLPVLMVRQLMLWRRWWHMQQLQIYLSSQASTTHYVEKGVPIVWVTIDAWNLKQICPSISWTEISSQMVHIWTCGREKKWEQPVWSRVVLFSITIGSEGDWRS